MRRELHTRFDALNARWRDEWKASGREGATIGLGAGLTYPDAAAAAAAAADVLAPGDLVVVKGSRGIGMETFVAAVKAAFGHPGAAGRAGGHH